MSYYFYPPLDSYESPIQGMIQVIASFSSSGQIIPLYAKLEGYTAKLINVTQIKQEPHEDRQTNLFRCYYLYDEIDVKSCKEIYLRYYIRRHVWAIEKKKK